MKQEYYWYYRTIGTNIGRFRREREMTQEQLAEAVNLSSDYISHLEALGTLKAPSLDTLIAIAQALDVPLYRLVMMEGEEEEGAKTGR
ncbi:MAG: helix-turn-helix transcriptional regulator [Clostridiales bacterium]|nr:helix-turn-helix transcriptional regulator [Clostridiales bacterium]